MAIPESNVSLRAVAQEVGAPLTPASLAVASGLHATSPGPPHALSKFRGYEHRSPQPYLEVSFANPTLLLVTVTGVAGATYEIKRFISPNPPDPDVGGQLIWSGSAVTVDEPLSIAGTYWYAARAKVGTRLPSLWVLSEGMEFMG